MSSRSGEAPLDKADNEHHAQFQHHMEVSNVENGKEPEAIAKSETKQPGSTNSGKKRSSYQYDPEKVTLKFLFANHDGLTVTIECKPADTVGEIKGALLSTWPDELPPCSGGDRIRLICMGKGVLMPDSRSLQDCQVPVFKTHPTPINVSIKPDANSSSTERVTRSNSARPSTNGNTAALPVTSTESSQGCSCSIL